MILSLPNKIMDKIFTLTKLIGVEGAPHVPIVQPPTSSLVIERLQNMELLYFALEYGGMKLLQSPRQEQTPFLSLSNHVSSETLSHFLVYETARLLLRGSLM
jgi:hypothetical protein